MRVENQLLTVPLPRGSKYSAHTHRYNATLANGKKGHQTSGSSSILFPYVRMYVCCIFEDRFTIADVADPPECVYNSTYAQSKLNLSESTWLIGQWREVDDLILKHREGSSENLIYLGPRTDHRADVFPRDITYFPRGRQGVVR